MVGTPFQGTAISAMPSLPKPLDRSPVEAFSAISFEPAVKTMRAGRLRSPGQYATARAVVTTCRDALLTPPFQTPDEHQHLSFIQGAGHGGSHPHLAHEFVSALVQNRDPYPNAVQSANWTCVGLCAHESALQGGKIVKLPAFTLA